MCKIRLWKYSWMILLACMFGFCLPVQASQQVQTDTSVSNPVLSSLKRPDIERVSLTSKGEVKLTWTRVKGAIGYEVYRKRSNEKEYKKIATTTKVKYVDGKGKRGKKYTYKVRAVELYPVGDISSVGKDSKTIKCKVRKKVKKTAYVGDSVMTGFPIYHVLSNSAKVHIYAKIGINTGAFYSSSMMSQLLRYNPDRLFIMLGMNGLVGSPSAAYMKQGINTYDKIVSACLKKNPDMEIVVMGVSPVSRRATVKPSSVKLYNQILKKKMSKHKNVQFFDPACCLAGADGELLSCYSGGDGIHWQKSAYETVLKRLNKFVKEYDVPIK